MVGASKILTVSYGTFSCTLEGFDDPFTAMKAIAEYFRELAADDRYFGAEPPTPDAEMLHRIAEREVQRRVEARVSEHGVVLTAKPDEAPATVDRPAARAEPGDDSDSIAAKLMRIRAVVAASRAASEASRQAEPRAEAQGEAAADPGDDSDDLAAEDDFSFGIELDEPTTGFGVTGEGIDVAAIRHPAPVVGRPDAAAEPAAGVAEDEAETGAAAGTEAHADEEAGDAPAVTSDMAGPAAADHAAGDAGDAGDVFAVGDDAPVAGEAGTADRIADTGTTASDAAVAGDTEGEPVAAAPEGVLDLGAWRTDDPLPADMAAHDAEAGDARTRPTAAGTPESAEGSHAALFAALVDDIAPAAGDEPQNEEVEAGDDAALLAGIGAAIGGDYGGGEAEAEDALMRELAAVAREARRDAHEGRAILESTSEDGDASIERLMEEAKSKLEGVENRRRFSAISHLKAAVAATVADRKLASAHDPHPQEPREPESDMDRYRDDLSKAVRPRRPETDESARTPRPTLGPKAPPLVLVTEQRIDEGTGSADKEVQPRRVSAGTFLREDEDEDLDADDDTAISPDEAKSFADFAERLGASSLPELLEAAAAYTATVEGQPHFSRPQILRKVADMAEENDYSREDGLRSFGLLLREGKIQKISRGQFRITDASKFMAEGRKASR